MTQSKAVIGIAFSPRSFAIAVVNGSDCVYHVVRIVGASLTIYEKLRLVRKDVLRVFRHLQPHVVAVTAIPGNAKAETSFPAIAAKEVATLARRRNITVRHIPLDAIQQSHRLNSSVMPLPHPVTARQKALQQDALRAAILCRRRS